MRARLQLATIAAAALALAPGVVLAQGLQVSPTQVELTRAESNALVTLQNVGPEPVRYQVSVLAWRQGPRGEMKLSRTRDVTFFPSLLTIEPGEKRNVRVAAATQFETVEKTYRIFVEELPRAPAPERARIQVLTRVGIPVYVEPPARAARSEIGSPTLLGRRFSFTVRNTGNVRIRPEQVRILGRDAAGGVVFEKELSTWYVLAQGERIFELEAPADGCSRLRTLSAEVVVEKQTMTAQLPIAEGACGP